MTNTSISQSDVKTHAEQCEDTIIRNVRLYLTIRGISQASLANTLGIKAPTLSQKMTGKIAWSVADLVNAADFLGVTPQDLMDDSMVKSAEAKYGSHTVKKTDAPVGAGTSRYLVEPEAEENRRAPAGVNCAPIVGRC
ncbi:helix-turn-helix domain-containing protein [Bifidobacterium moukalabense]|uniref:helix-turn-helix domain-containing protein n=1 Tax=Bifidobacterium moukalabense TaxID=1333651 RepID=UPI001484F903|nr:helix-turn-helix transcriptional regulator [Bifidobacterium moukalabense]